MKFLMYAVSLAIGIFGLWILATYVPAWFSEINSTDSFGQMFGAFNMIISIVGLGMVLFAGFAFYIGNKDTHSKS